MFNSLTDEQHLLCATKYNKFDFNSLSVFCFCEKQSARRLIALHSTQNTKAKQKSGEIVLAWCQQFFAGRQLKG